MTTHAIMYPPMANAPEARLYSNVKVIVMATETVRRVSIAFRETRVLHLCPDALALLQTHCQPKMTRIIVQSLPYLHLGILPTFMMMVATVHSAIMTRAHLLGNAKETAMMIMTVLEI